MPGCRVGNRQRRLMPRNVDAFRNARGQEVVDRRKSAADVIRVAMRDQERL
jgi:hypothetical protein